MMRMIAVFTILIQSHFKNILDELNWNNLNVIIDKNNTHTMNIKLIKKIYQTNDYNLTIKEFITFF